MWSVQWSHAFKAQLVQQAEGSIPVLRTVRVFVIVRPSVGGTLVLVERLEAWEGVWRMGSWKVVLMMVERRLVKLEGRQMRSENEGLML